MQTANLFHTALNFSSDCPHPTAKFALPETKFPRYDFTEMTLNIFMIIQFLYFGFQKRFMFLSSAVHTDMEESRLAGNSKY